MKKILIAMLYVAVAFGFIMAILSISLGIKKSKNASNNEGNNENILQIANSTEATTEAFAEHTETTTEETTEQTTLEFTVDMNFVGDLLLATNHNQAYENCFNEVADREPPEYFLSKVSDIFLADDFTVGDCENVFTDNDGLSIIDKGQYEALAAHGAAVAEALAQGLPAPEYTFQAFWFKSKAANANIIKAGGVDIVSLDNNHINDYGAQGAEDTKLALDEAGVKWGNSGKIVYEEKEGFRIAFIFGTLYYAGAEANILPFLEEAKENSDYQVIYFHGGEEAVHEPESWKVNACHILADNGADLILGDHPHVLQPREEYNGVNIVYSLGNFCFGGNRHPENRTIIFNEKLYIEKDLVNDTFTITDKTYDMIPCYVYTGDTNNWQPEIIEDEDIKQRVLDFMNGLLESPL